ncbi:MAG: hypothetical protein QOE33_512 [Acidobacteriota bacterium]|nr:hypothetical protein [Acidobacteriota bacterium]
MVQVDLGKFEKLSIEQLRTIATEVGINFLMGNENITDKEDILLALDEADLKELEESYNRVQISL